MMKSFQTLWYFAKFVSGRRDINVRLAASLVGLTFSDDHPVDMRRLLDIPTLDNVTVDKALFELYAAEFNAFNALPGNKVTVVPEPSTIGLLAIGLCALVNSKRIRRGPYYDEQKFCNCVACWQNAGIQLL